MTSSNINDYYDYAFKLLEYGKRMEEIGRLTEAYDHGYRPACEQLRVLYNVEVDPAKRNLLAEQITSFEGKIYQYQCQCQLPPATVAAVHSSKPGPIGVSEGKILLSRADIAYREAIKVDKAPPQAPNSRAEACYMKAAELYVEASKLFEESNEISRDQHNALNVQISKILDRVTQLKSRIQNNKEKQNTSIDEMLLEEFDNALPSEESSCPLIRKNDVDSNETLISSDHRHDSAGDLSASEIDILRRSSFINGRCFLPWMGDDKTEQFKFPEGKRYTDPDGLLTLSCHQISKQARYKRIHEIVGSFKSSYSGNTTDPVLIRTISPLMITQDLVADCSFVCSLCISAALEARKGKKLITSIIYPQDKNGIPVYNPSGKYIVKLLMNGVMRKVVVDDYLPVATHRNSQGKEMYQLLCSYSTDPAEMWISIVEKAYMKLNGGYDFPGSNSGIDLHALTGWIPEQVFFEEDKAGITEIISTTKPLDNRQRESDVWERIESAHKFGDCLITISTSNDLSKDAEEFSGLVPGHAYAVLNVCKAGSLRMLQVKNPWARRSWKGKFSSNDRGRWTPGLKSALGVSDDDFDKMDKQGVFWIDFTDCRQYFKSFFLNWNPSLFMFRTTIHDKWPLSLGPKIDRYYVGACPQYSLVVQGSVDHRNINISNGVGSSIWILLTRHVVTKEVDPDTLSSDAAAALRNDETFLTMHVYKGGKRIYAPSKPLIRGIYSSDPHVLSRIDISPDETKSAQNDVSIEFPHGKPIEYTLLLSQAEKTRDVYYTISVYSTTLPFQLKRIRHLPSNQFSVHGSWKAGQSAGGNIGSRLFYINPQYKLHIPPVVRGGIDMHIHAMYSKDISASISVVDVSKNNNISKNGDTQGHSNNNSYCRIDCIASDEAEILTSGSYRAGYCVCSTANADTTVAEAKGPNHKRSKRKNFHLQAGDYTVVMSAYSPKDFGNFVLTFATSAGSEDDTSESAAHVPQPHHIRKYFTVKKIPPEGCDLKSILFSGEWSVNDNSAGGCAKFGSYHLNPIYFLHLPSDSIISSRLNTAVNCGITGVGLNISVFDISAKISLASSESECDMDSEVNERGHFKPPFLDKHSECSALLRDITASANSAVVSSNDGVYVVRPTGAFVVPTLLKKGIYLVVPSTFEQISCEYIMESYFTPSVVSSKDFRFVHTS